VIDDKKSRKHFTKILFNIPCWDIAPSDKEDVRNVLGSIDLYCQKLEKGIPKYFDEIRKKQFNKQPGENIQEKVF
jgi:hypothetical protein